jgi:hypothetical protein
VDDDRVRVRTAAVSGVGAGVRLAGVTHPGRRRQDHPLCRTRHNGSYADPLVMPHDAGDALVGDGARTSGCGITSRTGCPALIARVLAMPPKRSRPRPPPAPADADDGRRRGSPHWPGPWLAARSRTGPPRRPVATGTCVVGRHPQSAARGRSRRSGRQARPRWCYQSGTPYPPICGCPRSSRAAARARPPAGSGPRTGSPLLEDVPTAPKLGPPHSNALTSSPVARRTRNAGYVWWACVHAVRSQREEYLAGRMCAGVGFR